MILMRVTVPSYTRRRGMASFFFLFKGKYHSLFQLARIGNGYVQSSFLMWALRRKTNKKDHYSRSSGLKEGNMFLQVRQTEKLFNGTPKFMIEKLIRYIRNQCNQYV
jgi:hypothetical protein